MVQHTYSIEQKTSLNMIFFLGGKHLTQTTWHIIKLPCKLCLCSCLFSILTSSCDLFDPRLQITLHFQVILQTTKTWACTLGTSPTTESHTPTLHILCSQRHFPSFQARFCTGRSRLNTFMTYFFQIT